MPVVHVNTTRPDLDADLSDAFNNGVIAEPQLFSELVEIQLHPITSRPGHSIEIFIYCQNEQHMETFIEVFISGQLETHLCNILNRLLLKIKPNAERLEITISIDIEEVLAIEEYTGIEGK